MRGSKNHSRLPSWGPHSSANNPSTSRTDASAGASGTNNGGAGIAGNNGLPPPPNLPFRGQSVGLGEPFVRSDIGNRDQHEKRKRPASESPPNGGMISGMAQQQSSPTQRGDPMSMSSILGPSSRNLETEKRRRLDERPSSSSTYTSPIKMEGSVPPPVPGTASSSGPKITATNVGNVGDSPASNLARRKWSGPIAEEAAQHAAAWRAQEQRWGSSRSPRLGGMTPLAGGNGPPSEQRMTPPIGNASGTKVRGNSPERVEGHKRQRSDGYQAINGSPLTRKTPLRYQSPPLPERQTHSTDSSPSGLNQSLPLMSRQGPQAKPIGQQQGGGVSFYRPGSPPQQTRGTIPGTISKPFSGGSSSHPYGQPSYQAYDNQGRPVEIDVDEVRGGAFAGHGSIPTTSQDQHAYRHGGGYIEQRHRPQQSSQARPPPPPPAPATIAAPSKASASHSTMSPAVVPANLPPYQQQHQQQAQKASNAGPIGPRPTGSQIRERETKRRSMTPNAPGPAKGLLAPRLEKSRLYGEAGHRPTVAMKNFNQGPKVDSEAVWEALEEIKRKQYVEDEGVALKDDEGKDLMKQNLSRSRHLGNFQYDPRKSPLLPGDLLQANIGATLEIRISGRHLGVGPMIDNEKSKKAGGSNWTLGWRANEQQSSNGLATDKDDMDAEDNEDDAKVFWQQDSLINRKLWGTDVYTDDSDIIAMCLHAGWLQGPVLQDVPSYVPPGKAMLRWRQMTQAYADQGLELESADKPKQIGNIDDIESKTTSRSERLSSTADLSVMIRIAPKLIAYKGSQRSGVQSRNWGNGHDGVSLVIEGVTLKESGYASGERGLRNAKHRIDHLARLKTLAMIAIDASTAEDDLINKVQGGGLVDIQIASKLSKDNNESSGKAFWQIDVNNESLVH